MMLNDLIQSLFSQPLGLPEQSNIVSFTTSVPTFLKVLFSKCGSGKLIVSIKPDLSEGKCVITA